MNWIILSYTLTRPNSSSRVAAWRRLKRLGTISPVGSLQILPARESCIEAFQWLAQEIRQEGGEALILYVDRFEGLTTQQVIALFCEARKKDYEEILLEIGKLEQSGNFSPALHKLRKQYNEIKIIDYFNCPEGIIVEKRLDALERSIQHRASTDDDILRRSLEAYHGKQWITRPRPHVDRLACTWLIRRFIDPDAMIRYSTEIKPDEIAFDMQEGEFTHYGNLCTFEVMIRAFGLNADTALTALSEIVHEIDLRDGYYLRPETTGVDALIQGLHLLNLSDAELEQQGIHLFAGLYASLSYQSG